MNVVTAIALRICISKRIQNGVIIFGTVFLPAGIQEVNVIILEQIKMVVLVNCQLAVGHMKANRG